MKRAVFIAVVSLLLPMGCSRKQSSVRGQFLALGDSYTIGESVAAEARWPVQLADMLRREGHDVGEPQIIATTGWTTGDLAKALRHTNPTGPFQLVGLLIGVNNQFQGRRPEEYRREFGDLLSEAIRLAGGRPSHVVVLSIPDYGVTPFGQGFGTSRIEAEINRFNTINRELTAQAGAQYVDITPVSREAAQHPDLVAPDGLHPSAVQYARWAELALPTARNALTQRPATTSDK